MKGKVMTMARESMFRSFFTITVLLFVSEAAMAQWGPATRITGYYVYDDGAAYFKTESNQNYDGCVNSNYIALDTTKPNFKAIWAQIVAAETAGLTVSVNYVGCLGNYPKAIAIAIPNIW